MQITIAKSAAVLVSLAYVIVAAYGGAGLPFVATVVVGVLGPLALIWFPEAIESGFRSWRRGLPGLQVRPSPGWLVAVMGWVLLVGIPLVMLWQRGQQ